MLSASSLRSSASASERFQSCITKHGRHQSSSSQSQQQSPKVRRSSATSLFAALLVLALPSAAYYYYDQKSRQTLALTRFVPCSITSIQPLTAQTSIYTLALPEFADPPPNQSLTAIYVAQPEIQIQRPFTPLQPLTKNSKEVQLLVKRYDEKGAEMSQYIHRQGVGGELLLRGPEVTWDIDPGAKHLTFIAGGTGITPFVQLIHHLQRLPASAQPSLSLLYASSTKERAFLEQDLQELLKSYSAPSTVKYLHTKGSSDDPLTGQLDKSAIQPLLLSEQDSKVIVCGPNAMVAAVAGPASQIPGRTAPVGGMLKSLGVKQEQLVRL